ncbi:charged multivesicular body protein 6-A-like [Pocillopora verrucosa]|uniref:charged multivesicular body protein 6-A-like n=1 Tax=Pocillopora verrucosa TaxID=203993 RepID=UPI0033422D52
MEAILSGKKETVPAEKPKITKQDEAVLLLKLQRDKLKQHQKEIQQNLEKDRQLAKKLLQEGKKNEAKLLLRKRKYQEQILERTHNQLKNLKEMVQQVQDAKSAGQLAQIEFQVANVLREGNEALKKMHEIMSIEDAEGMDETTEGIEYQRKIDELLSGSLTQEDEDAVLQELEEMTKSVTEKPPEVPTEEPLPEVTSKELVEKRQKEKKDERKAEMVPA